MKPVVRRGSQSQALAPDVDFVSQDENRVVDERGGRTPMGAPIGRALADEYEWEHDDEREYGGDRDNGQGYIPFPE
jgi:hypothetical protein